MMVAGGASLGCDFGRKKKKQRRKARERQARERERETAKREKKFVKNILYINKLNQNINISKSFF